MNEQRDWLKTRLAAWEAPTPGPEETARLVMTLLPLLPRPSSLRMALRPEPHTSWERLMEMLRAVRTQVGVFTLAFWLGSAAVMAAGVTLLLLGFDPRGGLVIYLVGPLLSYLGCALGFRATHLGTLEFELACPTSPRQLALARLVVILGYDLLLALLAAIPLWSWQGPALLRLALQWVGPLLLGAGATLALSLRIPSTRAAASVYGVWATLVAVSAVVHGGAGFGVAAELAMAALGLVLLAVALAALPAALTRMLAHASRTFAPLPS